jgi:hypothetical protein
MPSQRSSCTQFVALSAQRRLSAREHESDADSVQDATESRNLIRYFSEMLGQLRQAAHAAGGEAHQHWRDEQYTNPSDQPVRLLVAPSAEPHDAPTPPT